jgi:putative transposase
MSRQLRIELANGIHHVWSRGNNKQFIYLDDKHHRLFLKVFEETIERYGWRCLGYSLMGNHYHLLIQTPKPNLSNGMRRLNSVYARRFLDTEGRTGHLFGARFRSRLVENGPYLLRLLRYVARNPVKAELCKRPEDWLWSSTPAVLGLAEPGFVAVDDVLPIFGTSVADARARFCTYINEATDDDGKWLTAAAVLGSDAFVQRLLPGDQASPEIPRFQRFAPPDLSQLVSRPLCDDDIATAVFEHGYSMREVAAELGCHYQTISRRLARWREAERAARALGSGVEKAA